MPGKLTNLEVVKRIKSVHGNLYNLSNVHYVNRRTKIKLICEKHGEWSTYTEQLFRGQGCPRCAEIRVAQKQTLTFKEVVKRANKIHNNKYKYYDDGYENLLSHLKIECPQHGIFSQTGDTHIHQKSGCPDCGKIENSKKRAMHLDEFIFKARKVHSNKYNYSKVKYKRSNIKITINCHKHGDFLQKPNNHLRGVGCPNCNNSKGEDKVKRILKEKGIKFTQQKTFIGLNYNGKLKCDFYLPYYNTVIEFHGRQHYEPVRAWGGKEGFIEIIKRDKIKRDFLSDNGIKFLEIDFKEKDIENLILDFIINIKI